MKILILGANGMLGYTLFSNLSKNTEHNVFGTVRTEKAKRDYFNEFETSRLFSDVDISNFDRISSIVQELRPNVVINCIGIIKQLPDAQSHVPSIYTNSLFPHLLYDKCNELNIRTIHFSSDCVFKGSKGNYVETDSSDAEDLYGKTKYLGELTGENSFTFRTSIIGHELNSNVSLIDWFLSQESKVNGYNKAYFSGFPTIEFVNILENYVLPNEKLNGLYHVSAERISKFDLLSLVKERYEKFIEIFPNESVVIDRSLNSDRFKLATGYNPPSWKELIEKMYKNYLAIQEIRK